MRFIFLFLLTISLDLVFAQSKVFTQPKADREISYGLFAGGIYSSMSNLPDVIVPKGVYQGYTLKTKWKAGAIGGFFINWKYPQRNFSLQTETFYSGQSTDLNYQDINGLNYKMIFAYNYINIGVNFKYYLKGSPLYFGLGPAVGFNVSADNIKYSSNAQEVFGNSGTYFETDASVQKVLRESLTGRNYVYGTLCAGYEFKSKKYKSKPLVSVGVRYTTGFTDGLTTEENGHRYSENRNKISSLSLTVAYFFYFDNLTPFGQHR